MEKEKSLFNIFGHLNPINRQEKEVSLAEESERDEDAVIQIENLNIYIRNNHILKNVNLTLHDKKITCIIGPSGCGKTTLLRSINRMIDTTEHLRVEGRVLVSGEDIYDHKAEITHIRKKIGCFHNALLLYPCRYTITSHTVAAYMACATGGFSMQR